MTKPTVSFSRLSMFERCPAQYKAKYIDHVADVERDTQVGGRLAHAVIEAYHAADSAIVDEAALVAGVVAATGEKVGFAEDTAGILRRYVRGFGRRADRIVETEAKYSKELSNCVIHGYIDLVVLDEDGTIVVEDYKTGWSSEVHAEYQFQQDIYGSLVASHYPNREVGVRFNFVRWGIMTPLKRYTPEMVVAIDRRIEAVVAKIAMADRMSRYPATPGRWCQNCPVVVSCTKRQKMARKKQAIITPEQAKTALTDQLRFQAAADELATQLEEYVDGNGNVRSGGAEARYVASERTVIRDVDKLREALGIEAAKTYISETVNNQKTKKLRNDARVEDLWVVENLPTKFIITKEAKDAGPVPDEPAP